MDALIREKRSTLSPVLAIIWEVFSTLTVEVTDTQPSFSAQDSRTGVLPKGRRLEEI